MNKTTPLGIFSVVLVVTLWFNSNHHNDTTDTTKAKQSNDGVNLLLVILLR